MELIEIEHQMTSSWKHFWSRENILVLLGIVFGSIVGYFIKDGATSFESIEVIGYQIPSLISFGIVAGFKVQLASVLLSWATLYWSTKSYQNADLYYSWIIHILIGIPMGVLLVFNVFSGYLVALGFVTPFILAILLFWVVMIVVGWHTMHLFLSNAISLLPLYLVSTRIIWFIESWRSIV